MPTNDGHRIDYNLDNPDDLRQAVLNGLIWVGGSNVQRGIDYIQSGKAKLSDCKNVPDDIRSLLEGK